MTEWSQIYILRTFSSRDWERVFSYSWEKRLLLQMKMHFFPSGVNFILFSRKKRTLKNKFTPSIFPDVSSQTSRDDTRKKLNTIVIIT